MTGEATDRSDLQNMQIGEATDLVARLRFWMVIAILSPFALRLWLSDARRAFLASRTERADG